MPCVLLERTSHLVPQLLYALRNLPHKPVPRPPNRVGPVVDLVAAYAVVLVYDNAQRKDGRDDGGEGGAGRDHEHDDHLQPRGLLDGGASQDRTSHHTRDSDDTQHTDAQMRMQIEKR